ncbi:radical SAM family heme chaperone HemW [Anderseniella sp. Alg231-50]|uniref:radical SAM family heme chaperone HemW n=1 Tax=Anderseniella sp. Alg231-50 TaxID=1922226 RepID=UPI000D55FB3E
MTQRNLGIYVHWPFCKAKCPYCDFNSHVRHHGVDPASFGDALADELSWFARQTPGRTVTSVFFGGGTPSLMPPAIVGQVIDTVADLWPMADDVEITLESNPTSAEAANFAGYRSAGVSRVSVGIQALNEADLKYLGRQHSVEEGLAAFQMAARIFPRTSFDLIYARPGQTPDRWESELRQALAEQAGHMSLYQLTIEPETAFFRLHEAGQLATPHEDHAAEMYEITRDLTSAAGLPAYEVSNHARTGHECRHNMLYWTYGEYAGVGPGAHSRLVADDGSRRALATEKHPETWLGSVSADRNGVVEDTVVAGEDAAHECLLMGMRTTQGVSLRRIERMSGRRLDRSQLDHLVADGLVCLMQDEDSIVATPAGRQVLNSVIEYIAVKTLR